MVPRRNAPAAMTARAEPPALEFQDGIAIFRVSGPVVLGELARMLADSMDAACGQGATQYLVDLRGIEGLQPLSLADRAAVARRLAATVNGRLRAAAMITRPEFIDADHFGVVVALGHGLVGEVFDDEAEAMRWLRDH